MKNIKKFESFVNEEKEQNEIKPLLIKELSKHNDVIGNKWIPFRDAIEIEENGNSIWGNIITNIKNPTKTNSMSGIDFDVAYDKVREELNSKTKPLIKELKNILSKTYKNIEISLLVEDEGMGDGEYWAAIEVNAEKK